MSFPPPARTLAPALALATLLSMGSSGCFLQHHANTNPLANLKSNQPDKALFDAAMGDLDKGKYTVARLNLETLLNTYPDSEYLARAKMGIADSWYREGGIEGMAQAEAQYKDFITFFPAMKEASEAQLKVATIHYRQLQKPDRDPTEANRAQQELRTFLTNYPDSPLRSQALQMLRDTQEILAEREYRIGEFYMERAHEGEYADYRAAQSRLEDVSVKYPLYSQGDVVMDELATSYLTTSKLYQGASTLETIQQTKNLYLANADTDRQKAIQDFDQVIERYPLSPLAKDASRQLAGLKAPVPKPSEDAIAFNRQEIAGRTQVVHKRSLWADLDPLALVSAKPATELARADKVGSPALMEAELPPDPPPPGLDALLRDTLKATGAIPATTTATLIPPGSTAPVPATGGGSPNAVTATQAPKALAFQDVPDKPRGADTPESATPQSLTGSNDTDPNARRTSVADNPNYLLTPNEVDLQNREQILAAEVHRDVPAPLAELKKNAANQAKTRDAAIAKLKKEGKLPATQPATPTAGNDPAAPKQETPAAPKKGFFSRIWPL
ncbi:MAG TPA: outer membrane protein assembly factor BamD [Terriglobales bacterium]|nr:outer membrane protein assembly factor BamD [Terriglobales bacterium]